MIEKLLRAEVQNFKNYQIEKIPYKYKLDANEVFFNLPEDILENMANIVKETSFNIYPDTTADELRDEISKYCKVERENILVSNGSDEAIHLLNLAFVDKDDEILIPSPSFAMYSIYARLSGGKIITFPLGENFEYNLEIIFETMKKQNPKMIFICNPNNPTGTTIEPKDILKIVEKNESIVVVDEAYYEFCGKTVVEYVENYENLVVLRTFSKAFGLAGLRIGYAVSNKNLISYLQRVKPPFNTSSFSQKLAVYLLKSGILSSRVEYILKEREILISELNRLKFVKVYPTESNFVLCEFKDSEFVYKKLLENGILVRNFPKGSVLENCLRITVGSREANEYLLEVLKGVNV